MTVTVGTNQDWKYGRRRLYTLRQQVYRRRPFAWTVFRIFSIDRGWADEKPGFWKKPGFFPRIFEMILSFGLWRRLQSRVMGRKAPRWHRPEEPVLGGHFVSGWVVAESRPAMSRCYAVGCLAKPRPPGDEFAGLQSSAG